MAFVDLRRVKHMGDDHIARIPVDEDGCSIRTGKRSDKWLLRMYVTIANVSRAHIFNIIQNSLRGQVAVIFGAVDGWISGIHKGPEPGQTQ